MTKVARREDTSPGRIDEEPGRPEPGLGAFLWGTWGLMTLLAFGLVTRYGTDVPVWDDYAIVDVLVGARPLSIGWLWEQHNEHRYVVPKLALVLVDRLAGYDVRAGMFLSVALMSASSATMLRAAGRLGGGPRTSDAFFPILLLHPGHATNFLWSFQLAVLLPTAIATAFLAGIAGRARWPGPGTSAVAGLALAVLPLCGGNGLVFVPPLATWLIAGAVVEARSGWEGGRRRGALIAVATAPGLALTALYFVGFRPGLHPEAPGGALDGARAAIQFLAGGVGVPAAWAWPWSGVATAALVGLAVAWVARAWATRPEERPRIFGLAAFLAGVAAMAAAVGWGRGWSGDRAGFQDRYIAMAAPLWCWLAIAVRLYAPRATGRVIADAIFVLSCVLLWPNAEAGIRSGIGGLRNAQALARDIRDGVPPYQVVRRHTPYLYPTHDEVTRLLPSLRRAGLGPFGALRDDPPFRETRLEPAPVSTSLVRWEGTTAHATGVDPWVTFALPSPRYVAGIRIRYSHANPEGSPARFLATWAGPGQVGSPPDRRYADWNLPTGTGRETIFWVDGPVERFRVQPDNQPCTFRFEEIAILEPLR